MRARALLGAALVAIVVMPAVDRPRAATVEVNVVERGGDAVPNQWVVLYPLTPELQREGFLYFTVRAAGRCTTGPSGRCTISELPAGVYVPILPGIADPNLCAPPGSPVDAFGTVTISKPDASAPIRIELQRGVRIQVRVISESPIPSGSRIEVSGDGGEHATARLSDSGAAQLTLGSGRWIAHLVGPPGARVVGVELDGAEVPTLDVPIEVIAPSPDRFITWKLSRPCFVNGRVTSNVSPSAVVIVATLVAPGPWGASALCRGTTCAPPMTASLSLNGRFTLELPSGTWRLAPAGESLLESDPEFIELNCAGGEVARADFAVREGGDGGSKPVLTVQVIDPSGRPVADVPVEVWPAQGNIGATRPIATESTRDFGMPAVFTRLVAGRYLLRARSPGYRTSVLAVPDVDPERKSPRSVTIQLDPGATIDALVTDEKERPITGVGLEIRRTDAPPPSDDPIARLMEQDAIVSVPPSKDQTGHVLVSGLAGGTYEVRPVLSGAIAAGAVATVAIEDRQGGESVVVVLGEHDRKELRIRVRPAASFTGRLVCMDGGLMPRQVDVCVLGLPADDEDEAARDTCRKPAIATSAIALDGDDRDVFRVGPLTDGSYRLGLRPRGYGVWTWALGTPDGSRAASLQVNGTDAVDLGIIKVLCGPAVEVRPSVLSRDPVPDLTVATVVAELSRTGPEGKPERRVVVVERDRDRVALRELPEGEWTLDVTIAHPFFVPAAPARLRLPVKLERGQRVRTGVDIAGVGGAIAIDAPTGAARLAGPDGATRIEPAHDGTIEFRGVAAGSYGVELCDDAGCGRVARRWNDVRVEVGRKAVLAVQPR